MSPLSPSPLLRVSIFFFFFKKSVSPHDSLAVHPDRSERSPTLPSSTGLCVRQIENEQQSTVGGVTQPLKVMALARPLAGPDNAVPSLPGSDSWLSEKKQKKNPKLVPARLGAVKLHFRCCRNISDVGLVSRLCPLTCLTVSCTCAIYSRSVYATSQRHDL